MSTVARVLGIAITTIAICTAIVDVVTLVPVHPASLLAHFRVQLVAGGVVVVLAALALRRWQAVDVALIATLVTSLAIVPDLAAARRHVPDGTHVRLLSLNVLGPSRHFDEVARLVATERPDVIALVEARNTWVEALAPAVIGYERIEAPRTDNLGVALYVRGTLRGEVRMLANDTPNIFAEVTIGDAAFRMVVVHPIPPMTEFYSATLEAFFAQLGALVRGDPRMIVAGDFNATPWSRPFAAMMGASALCDSRAGFGVQASFPASSWILRIPIDHVLTSCAIGVRDRRIGPDVGSDHLPVIVDLVIPR